MDKKDLEEISYLLAEATNQFQIRKDECESEEEFLFWKDLYDRAGLMSTRARKLVSNSGQTH
jgi:hypothetical protein